METTVTQREPAIVIGLVTAAVAAILVCIAAFGIHISPEQQVAIIGVIAGVGPLITAWVTRGKVTPTALVVETVTPDGTRVAGEASLLPTGSVIPPADL